ncbi:hypothetical protein IGI37_001403 [Enterococcus sp. AZ194]|uniref:helix-turn-helix domain-containing protein n=1 Tax=Enterococcus sp. AZ194 TaxID=2774629 RepID=UPI003F23566F
MFSEILKNRRTELGLTQEELADKLFVSRQTVSNWENGKNYPDIPTLIAISEHYSLSLDYLLKGDVRFMKKIEDDYRLIKQKKTERIASIITASSILLIIFICLIQLFLQSRVNDNIMGLLVIAICLPLAVSSYILYKSFYKKDEGTPQPLFVPKAYGIGITVNPNHPAGKLIWFLLGLMLLGLFIHALLTI